MDHKLINLLRTGGSVITPTQRLSRHLQYQYAKYQLKNGSYVWQTPDCLPWTAWCKRTFRILSYQNNDDSVLLNKIQQQWIWQDIIRRSAYQDQLLKTSATANQARQAYQLCKAWCLPIFPEEVYLSKDAIAFKNWAHCYEKYKEAHHYLDEDSLPDYISNAITRKKNPFVTISFYGFDTASTQQQKLLQLLTESGTEVIEIAITDGNQSVTVSEQHDLLSELIAAACWAKQQLQQDTASSIGIISPNLNAIRHSVERAFQTVFEPAQIVCTEQPRQKVYSISVGKPLLNYPLIHTAMNLLSLGSRRVALNTLGGLLHSPFIKDAILEQAQRSNFDAALRKTGEQYLQFDSLYQLYAQYCHKQQQKEQQCATFIQLLKSFETAFLSQEKKQPLQLWISNFSKWLSLFGWPGERPLNSDEQQTLMAWQTALIQLRSLDVLSQSVDFITALDQLNQILSQTRFQPETDETPIQILRMTGAAGMRFDYLWVLNMQAEHWPELLPSNPFIPPVCQREFSLPTAAPELQLERAKQLTKQLIKSSKQIVFSYAKQQGGSACSPSPLIKPYTKNKTINSFNQYQDFKKTIYASAQLEYFVDIKAPTIPTGTIANGGSALFKDQAACPFKAFARHRLHAQALKPLDIGLSALERGNLVHRSLQYLWQELKTKKALADTADTELEILIQSAVAKAIRYQLLQQPETFTDRFTELEQQRLQQRLKEWLSHEQTRLNFNVIATEQSQTRIFQDIELHLRVDRVDELADGRCVIIDYKTGNVNKNDWSSENPNDPQLPLYAITSEQEIAAIAFACLKPGNLGFIGLADSEQILPGVKPNSALSWQEQLDYWEKILVILANDFRAGKAIVAPTPVACRYCDLHLLCRIDERRGVLSAQKDSINDPA